MPDNAAYFQGISSLSFCPTQPGRLSSCHDQSPRQGTSSVMIDSSGLVERFRGTSRAEHEGNMMPCSAVQEKHRSSAKYRDDGSKQLYGIPALNQHGSQPE